MIPTTKEVEVRPNGVLRNVFSRVRREREFLLTEVLQVKGLMPLLMKPRNKQAWSNEDKAALAAHLKRLSTLSPYLVVAMMPGGFFALPALSWWLDRRRNRPKPTAAR